MDTIAGYLTHVLIVDVIYKIRSTHSRPVALLPSHSPTSSPRARKARPYLIIARLKTSPKSKAWHCPWTRAMTRPMVQTKCTWEKKAHGDPSTYRRKSAGQLITKTSKQPKKKSCARQPKQ